MKTYHVKERTRVYKCRKDLHEYNNKDTMNFS